MTESLGKIAFDENLVIVDLEAETSDEAIRALGNKFLAGGHVAEGYIDAVIRREHDFATGLPTAIPVALPHAEATDVHHSALAVGVLREPVEFHEMGNPDSVLDVRVVFLLALVDPKDQVKWLQRFMRGLRDESFITRLLESASPREAVDLVRLMLELDSAKNGGPVQEARPGR